MTFLQTLWQKTFGHSLSTTVRAIQSQVASDCNFMPDSSAIAAMIASPDQTAKGATAIAEAICEVVSPKPQGLILASSTSRYTVNGIHVTGHKID